MKRKLVTVLASLFVMNAVLGVASAAPADVVSDVPAIYSDVPADHWSYGALKRLTKAGVISGYGDGTVRGNATVSRYEMATIVANAMTKLEKTDAENKALINKLASEYAAELKTLGVRVGELEKFKKSTLKVGMDLFAFFEADNPSGGNPKLSGNDQFNWRGRFWLSGDVNDKTAFNARLGTGTAAAGYSYSTSKQNNTLAVDRFYITQKDALGFDSIQLGRQGIKGLGGNLLYKSGNNDGVKFTKKLSKATTGDIGVFNVKQEPAAVGTFSGDSQAVQYMAVETKVNSDLKLGAMFVNNDTKIKTTDTAGNYSTTGSQIGGVSATYKMGKWTLLGEYDWAQLNDPVNVASNPRAWAIQLTNGTASTASFYPVPFTVTNINKPGDHAYVVSYHRSEKGAIPYGLGPWNSFFTSPTYTVNGKAISGNDNLEGWYFSYQYVVAKNFEVSFDYQKLKFTDSGKPFDDIFMVIANVSI